MSASRPIMELMREYDKERQAAARKLNARKTELYAQIPRISEIDRELASTAMSLAKMALFHKEDTTTAITAERISSEKLQAERAALIANSSFPPDYLEDIYKCRSCNDTGYIGQARCQCLKQRLVGKYYELSNLSKTMTAENFDTFNMDYYSEETDPKTGISPHANIRKIWSKSLDFVSEFDTVFRNLLLYGNTGLGKTFLCNCIAKELLNQGKTVLYTTAAQMFRMVEKARFGREDDQETQEEYIEMLTDVDLLIIDDLGTEFSTILTSAELFRFINTRLLDQKHTIISTNLSPADFEGQYSDRVTSRLFGGYEMLRFIGDDIRLKKKYGQ